VAEINGDWWMTRNLAIGCNGSGSSYGSSASSKSLTSTYSNVSKAWSTPTAGLSKGDSYDTPYMTCNSTYGAWYNYAAASAGTITGSSNSTAATKDICPAGWRLPTNTEQSGITSSSTAFSPVTGGRYSNGSISLTGRGYWWSATANGATTRYLLNWYGSSLNTYYVNRSLGFYVRCIRSS
ncbi:MAG: FISUMP domain-containing protein, partial [Candidatus Saccharibacteria bacterium]|nr:FISUMP domain-containing protein [Candidatus Saccharibacteria bacterium]